MLDDEPFTPEEQARVHIHPPLISTEIHQHLAALPLHILLGTTKKAMDILTDYCIEHDSIVKQIKGDTGEHM